MKALKPEAFASEAAMCATFIAAIGDQWTAYAETCGWDILLARKADGFQIGIQAKLRMGVEVINQAIEDDYPRDHGPDCRAVLVPDSKGFSRLADYIGLTIIVVRPSNKTAWGYQSPFSPRLPGDAYQHREEWFELYPTKRHKLPDYVPDVAAGASAPLQLTDWKIRAIKIAVIIERRGYVTREDFKQIGIDIRRWMPRESGWLAVGEGGFVAGPKFPNLRLQHPIVFEQIVADADKWMPPAPLALALALPKQTALL